jgi:putative transposase
VSEANRIDREFTDDRISTRENTRGDVVFYGEPGGTTWKSPAGRTDRSFARGIEVVRKNHPFKTEAIVVLPDHLHCLWRLPPGDSDYGVRWGLIKAAFSRGLPIGERRSVSRTSRGERGIWQRRFWEHLVRDEEDFARHADYIHYNPVKHGWAKAPHEWAYSSFRRYVEQEIYTKDWGANEQFSNVSIGE